MLLSVALILLCGMGMSWICKKLKLPGLLGMLLTGIVLGPYVLNLLDENLLNISSELRKMALIIILMRAGLGLDVSGLKKIGRPAVMMCFVPATFELLGMLVLAPRLLGLSVLEAAILGSVLAAVSPAVIVPRMVRLMEEGYGTEKGIPQLILAGASVDDVYVIVLFTTFSGIMQGKSVSVMSFLNIPISIILGMIIGLLAGWLLARYFEKVSCRTQGSRFNLWRTDLPNGRGLCMSAWNGYEWKRKIIYDDGIHTESKRTGCNRRNPAGTWICVWRCGSDGSSACNCTDCTAWSICD